MRAERAMGDPAGDTNSLDATRAAADGGDAAAAADLFATLCAELHRVAQRQLSASGGAAHSLSSTTLLHEAYLNMHDRSAVFPDRARFFAYAARAMRGLIIDYMRARRALKRGSEFHLTSLDTEAGDAVAREQELVPLADAIDELAVVEPALGGWRWRRAARSFCRCSRARSARRCRQSKHGASATKHCSKALAPMRKRAWLPPGLPSCSMRFDDREGARRKLAGAAAGARAQGNARAAAAAEFGSFTRTMICSSLP